jgi:hypothetical protein
MNKGRRKLASSWCGQCASWVLAFCRGGAELAAPPHALLYPLDCLPARLPTACLPAVNMFEDVDPVAVLEKRVAGEEGGGHTEWLVKFEDEEEVREGGSEQGWAGWGGVGQQGTGARMPCNLGQLGSTAGSAGGSAAGRAPAALPLNRLLINPAPACPCHF